MKKTTLIILAISLVMGLPLVAENLSITGIDSTGILNSQEVDLYITHSDSQGNSVEEEGNLNILESPDGQKWLPVKDFTIDKEANRRDGIGFLMLMDNSGSMYDNLDGRETENQADQRMTHAKRAMSDFLNSIDDSRDRVALVTFNTDYTQLAESTRDRNVLIDKLDMITKPESTKAYTELFSSLEKSSRFFSDQTEQGRKIIIVLSDGENYPFYKYNGELHPEFGNRLYTPQEASESLNKEGVTLYAIHFGIKQDPFLEEIAKETGGRVFDARNAEQLTQVYSSIRDAVMKEYKVTYKAHVFASPRIFVKIGTSSIESEARYYYNSALFGESGQLSPIILIIILLIALALWLALTKIRLERVKRTPHIELIGPGGLHNRVLDLSDGKTIIGTSEDHDMTIAGEGMPPETESATIIYDEKKQAFTLVAGEGESTMVNNQKVKTKDLEAGDVIKVGDNLIIFDDEGTQVR